MRIHGAGKRGVCVVKTIGAKSEQLSPSTDSHCAAATGVCLCVFLAVYVYVFMRGWGAGRVEKVGYRKGGS